MHQFGYLDMVTLVCKWFLKIPKYELQLAYFNLELNQFGGGPVVEAKSSSDVQAETPPKAPGDLIVAFTTSAPHFGIYKTGIPSQRPPSFVVQGLTQRIHQKCKVEVSDKISRIYGDWIDDVQYILHCCIFSVRRLLIL